MKQCPKCNKTYDDTWGVCLQDNSQLSNVQSNVAVEPTPQSQETTQCPFCKETIIKGAIKCKHCGEFLNKQNIPSGKFKGSDNARAIAKGLKEKEAQDTAYNFLIGCALVVAGFLGYALKSWWVFGIVLVGLSIPIAKWYYKE